MDAIRQSVLYDPADHQEEEEQNKVSVAMAGPMMFTHGKTMYSQVKAPFKMPQLALDSLKATH